jgi:hypothetical protein
MFLVDATEIAGVAVIADAHAVPDPEAITQQFNREFERMRRGLSARAATTQAKVPPRHGSAHISHGSDPRQCGGAWLI